MKIFSYKIEFFILRFHILFIYNVLMTFPESYTHSLFHKESQFLLQKFFISLTIIQLGKNNFELCIPGNIFSLAGNVG